MRGINQWITVIERGRITAPDDLYVRALASRYGNPDKIPKQDHVPTLPGINVPGKYDDYGRDPGRYKYFEKN